MGLVQTTAINSLAFDTLLGTLTALAIGVGILLWGFLEQCNSTAAMGVSLLGVAVLPSIVDFIGTVDFTNRVTLAVLGVITIVVGSLVERVKRNQS